MQSTHLKCTILNFPGSLLAKNSVLPLQGAVSIVGHGTKIMLCGAAK